MPKDILAQYLLNNRPPKLINRWEFTGDNYWKNPVD